jgi:hypothetical protein
MNLARHLRMNPQEHQRDVGEKEHYPRQEGKAGPDQRGDYVDHKRKKAKPNNTHRNEQTGKAEAEAARTRERAKNAA